MPNETPVCGSSKINTELLLRRTQYRRYLVIVCGMFLAVVLTVVCGRRPFKSRASIRCLGFSHLDLEVKPNLWSPSTRVSPKKRPRRRISGILITKFKTPNHTEYEELASYTEQHQYRPIVTCT